MQVYKLQLSPVAVKYVHCLVYKKSKIHVLAIVCCGWRQLDLIQSVSGVGAGLPNKAKPLKNCA